MSCKKDSRKYHFLKLYQFRSACILGFYEINTGNFLQMQCKMLILKNIINTKKF